MKRVLDLKSFEIVLSFLILSAAIFVSFWIITQAQTQNIVFPIAELGNCKNQEECRIYCDKTENIETCVNFAESRNLISAEEAARARKFKEAGPGPGGCETKDACESYCEDTAHIEECLSFAEKHGLMPEDEIKKAKVIAGALKEGVKLPGGCKGKKQCDLYCSEPGHLEECFSFAERTGFLPKEEREKAKKVMPFMARGETPGSCRSKDQCESYCADSAHFEECVSFAEKVGFIDKGEAARARKTGGKGPGDCNSRESCEAFCNKPENGEICFNFAKEHGLIPEEKLEEMKEGMGRMRMGLAQAPAEVLSCLKDNLGGNIIEKIESGEFIPGPQIGEQVKNCFEKFMPQMRSKMKEELRNAPSELRMCLKETVGEEILDKIEEGEAPKPEIGDKMRGCFEKFESQRGGQREGEGMTRENLKNLPGEARQCLEGKFGAETVSKVFSGELKMIPEIANAMRECLGGARGEENKNREREDEGRRDMYEMPGRAARGGGMPMSADVQSCAVEIYGEEMAIKIKDGGAPPPADWGEKINICMKSRFRPQTPQLTPEMPPQYSTQTPPSSGGETYQVPTSTEYSTSTH